MAVCINNDIIPVNKQWNEFVKDSGAPFRHPIKDNLSLDDLFVYPEVQLISYEKNNITYNQTQYSMEEIIFNDEKCIIFGEEKSGKSHCCKKIFLEAVNKGFFPLLISVNQLKKIHSTCEFSKNIEIALNNIYDIESVDIYKQISQDRLFLIIDDFHALAMDGFQKFELLNELCSIYTNIKIFSDDSSQFDPILNSDKFKNNFFNSFTMYLIQPFGYKKRDELLKKWYSNSTPYDDEGIAEREIEQSRLMLTNIIKNSFVPSYPFFLYTALSSFNMPNLKIEESTYGNFYTTLLNIAIMNISVRNDENDLYFNYLSEFAYRLYSLGSSCLSVSDYWIFHEWYVKEFSLPNPRQGMFGKLKEARLLQEKNNTVFFRYKYFYFYFLAKYLSGSLGDEKTKRIIKIFCDTLHQETSSNVLLFLIHLSKDQSIINMLIEKSNMYLRKFPLVNLTEDSKFLEELVNCAPAIEYDLGEDFDEQHKKRLKLADNIDPVPKGSAYSGEAIEPVNPEELTSSAEQFDPNMIIDTFKLLEIIGQILRNYHGSLRSSLKKSLCKSAYDLTSRGISCFFRAIFDNKNSLLEELKHILGKIDPNLKEKREYAARRYLYWLASIITYTFIIKCSIDLSSDNLRVTFKDVFAEYEDDKNLLVSMIDISIKLNTMIDLPIEDIKHVYHLNEKCNIGVTSLQLLAIRHLRMYKLKIAEKQQLCQAVNISIKKINQELFFK